MVIVSPTRLQHRPPETDSAPVACALQKQGISTTDEGRGALSSAFDVMIKISQVPAGVVWGGLFSLFANAKPGTLLGQIGPGGHFIVAAFVRLVALWMVRSIPDSELQLAEST